MTAPATRLTLPGTALSVSALCLGGNRFGGDLDEAASFALLDAYAERGGNFIDTAHVYADWIPGNAPSSSERTIGRWLADRRPAGIVVATKGGHPPLDDPATKRLDLGSLRSDVEGSLACLGVAALDLFYLHRDDPGRPAADVLSSLERLRSEGLIRHYAASNWSVARLREAEAAATAENWAGFVASQVEWSLARRNLGTAAADLVAMDPGMVAFHRRTRLTAVPYSAQARGYFDKVAGAMDPATARAYDSAANRDAAALIGGIAAAHGASPTQVMLAALIRLPFPVVPVIGPRTPAQVAASWDALSIDLDGGALERLSALACGPTAGDAADRAPMPHR